MIRGETNRCFRYADPIYSCFSTFWQNLTKRLFLYAVYLYKLGSAVQGSAFWAEKPKIFLIKGILSSF